MISSARLACRGAGAVARRQSRPRALVNPSSALATMQPSGNDDPPQTPEFNRQLFTSLVQGTRQSNALPGEHEHAAYSASMAGLGDRLTTMMTGFMPPGDESEFDRVRNLTDRALEQVDQNLDAARGVGATEGTPVLQTPQPRGTPAIPGSALSAGGSVTKPQMKWAVEVGAGNSDEPFMPKLRVKPNARVPLELRLERAEEEADGDAPARRGPQTWYANPYAFEIGAFQPSEVRACTRPRARARALPATTPAHAAPPLRAHRRRPSSPRRRSS